MEVPRRPPVMLLMTNQYHGSIFHQSGSATNRYNDALYHSCSEISLAPGRGQRPWAMGTDPDVNREGV